MPQRDRPVAVATLPSLTATCPDTEQILRDAGFVVHPQVTAITLHGSRGPRRDFRPDSDVDMCLIVDTEGVPERSELARCCAQFWIRS